MKKKLLALMMIFVLVFMTACGSKSSKDEKKSGKANAYSVTVAGERYSFSAKNGIDNFDKMPGVGYYKYGSRNMDITAVKLKDGNATDDKCEIEDINCVVQTHTPFLSYLGTNGSIKSDNGFMLMGGLDFSTLNSKLYGDADTDFCAYKFTFVNDFNYMGIKSDSKIKDVEKAGFKEGYLKGTYYNIFSSADISFEDIEEDYEKFSKEEYSSAAIQKGDKDSTFKYVNEYRMAIALSSNDAFRMDVGISKEVEEKSLGAMGDSFTDNYYKDFRMLSLLLGKQLYSLSKGDTDYIVFVDVTPVDAERNAWKSTYVNVTIIAKKDKVTKWAENWGWKEL